MELTLSPPSLPPPSFAFLPEQKKPSMIQDDGTKPWIWVQKEEFQAKADEIKNTETLQAGMDIGELPNLS